VRHVEGDQARLRRGSGLRQRCLRRDHRVEQRQTDGDADALQERPPRQVLLADEHRLISEPQGLKPPRYRTSLLRGRRLRDGFRFLLERIALHDRHHEG
jgi:hypothetical protein